MPDKPNEPDAKLRQLLSGVAAGDTHGWTLSEYVANLGPSAMTFLAAELRNDVDGKRGRAAVIGLREIAPEVALPLIEEALRSNWAAARYYAAEYLSLHKTEACRKLARKVVSSEADPNVRSQLEDL